MVSFLVSSFAVASLVLAFAQLSSSSSIWPTFNVSLKTSSHGCPPNQTIADSNSPKEETAKRQEEGAKTSPSSSCLRILHFPIFQTPKRPNGPVDPIEPRSPDKEEDERWMTAKEKVGVVESFLCRGKWSRSIARPCHVLYDVLALLSDESAVERERSGGLTMGTASKRRLVAVFRHCCVVGDLRLAILFAVLFAYSRWSFHIVCR